MGVMRGPDIKALVLKAEREPVEGTWHRADRTPPESPLAWLLSALRQCNVGVMETDSGAQLLGFEFWLHCILVL